MGHLFHQLVDSALAVERELRPLIPGRPSLRCYIAECLSRAGATYEEVEAQKERLAEEHNSALSGSAAYVRDLTRQIASGRLREPPEKTRISKMYWNQKDQAILELGGRAERLFLLWIIAAELAYHRTDGEAFGTVEDLAAHKARIAELEGKRKELYGQFPATWTHGDLFIGKITSDGAALISFRLAPNEIPLHPFATAGERLCDYLLKQEETKAGTAKAA